MSLEGQVGISISPPLPSPEQLGLWDRDTLGQWVLCCHELLESVGVRQLSGQR